MKKRDIFIYWIYLLAVWGIFRLLFRLPLLQEELIIKPLVWGWPILGWRFWGKIKVKLLAGDTFKAIMGGLGLGLGFTAVIVVANWIKSGLVLGQGLTLNLNGAEIVTLGLATAIVQELVFSGVILMELRRQFKNDTVAMVVTTFMFVVLNLPIALFVYGYSSWGLVGFGAIVGLTAWARYWLMIRTNNVWAPIVAHWIWGVVTMVVL